MTRKSKGLVANSELKWADVNLCLWVEVGFSNRIRTSTFCTHGLDSGIVSLGTLGTLLEEKKYYEKVTVPIQWPYPVGLS